MLKVSRMPKVLALFRIFGAESENVTLTLK